MTLYVFFLHGPRPEHGGSLTNSSSYSALVLSSLSSLSIHVSCGFLPNTSVHTQLLDFTDKWSFHRDDGYKL